MADPQTTDTPSIACPDMWKGILRLKLLRHEHPHADVFNLAIEQAAWYIRDVWGQPGKGAHADD